MSGSFAGVVIAVDFYTFEGGQYNLLASDYATQILNCTVTNTILPGGGGFILTLAPGGPNGIAASPQWSEVITPMSLCVIALARGSNQCVVHVGVVTKITDQQTWSNGGVTRTTTVTGADLTSYFWTQFNFASLAFLAGNILAPLGQGVVGNPGGGWFLNAGFQGVVSPSEFAQQYFTKVMFQSGGLLGRTVVPYQGNMLPLSAVVGTRFDEYNGAEVVPYADSFLTSDGPWIDKFNEALPFPIYENFTVTAPVGTYVPLNYTGGVNFTSTSLTAASGATPSFICRLTPQPNLIISSTQGANQAAAATSISQTSTIPPYVFTGVDYFQYNALTTYQLLNEGFIDSQITFSPNNNYNFYTLNSLGLNYLWGGDNSNVNAIQFYNFGMLADPASISRYGWRPLLLSNSWFVNFDPNNSAGLSPDAFQSLVAAVMTRLASYLEPLPLMGNGSITMECRPDIFPGNFFSWNPFRNSNDTWQAYVNTVTHSYQFGGPTTTVLSVERALPTYVYSNADLLGNVMQGNAQKINGQYVTGVPAALGKPLIGYAVTNQTSLLAAIANGYVSPQFK